jgi:tape measure domain-containing protein
MPVVGIAEIEVKPVFKGTQAAIGQMVDGSAASAGTTAGKTMGSRLGGALSTTVKATAGVALAGLTLALTKGFGRLQAIENAKAKLTGLGHSADTVAGIMKNATASVKGTAFGLDEAATVAAGAVASGVKPGKELERTLKLTGDAATIAGVGMSDMGAIFNKVASSNKIQGDVIAQLSDAGIPVVQLLGKELGKTSEEISNMSRKGEIDFAAFQNAMEKGMGGAALESGKTLQGAFKNTMASLGRIGANLLSGVYPLFTKFFQGLIKWMEPLETKAKVVGAAIGSSMEKAGNAAMGLFSILAKGDFTGGLGVEEDSKLVAFLFNVREAMVKLAGFMQGAGAILFKGDFIGHGIMGVEEDSKIVDFLFKLRDGFLSIGVAVGMLNFSSWDAFKSSAADAGGTVGGAFASIGESLHTLGPAFGEFGRQLPNITGAFVKLGGVSLNVLVMTLGFLADHVDTIIKWMPVIVAGFIAWRVATKLLASAQFTLQAAQVAAAPVLLANNILRYASVRAETSLAVATGQTTVVTNASIAAKIRDRIATAAGTAVTWAATTAQKAAAVATRLLGVAIKFAMGPMGLVLAAISLLVAGLVWFFTQTDLGKGIVKNAFAAIQSVIAAVVDWWNQTLIPVLKSVGKWFADVWNGASEAVGTAVRWIQDALGNVVNWIKGHWGVLLSLLIGRLSMVVQWVVEHWSQISKTIGEVFTNVGNWFTWLYGATLKPFVDSAIVILNGFYLFFRGIFQLVVSIFVNILAPAFMMFWHGVVEPVFAGIALAAQLWWSTVSGIFTGVVNFVTTVLGAVFTWFRDAIITPVFNFIVAYISFWWTTISTIFTTAVGFIRTVLGVVFTWLRDAVIVPVFSFIAGVVTTWWTGVSFVFNLVIGFIRNALAAVFTWFRDTIITPVWNGIAGTIKSVWENNIKPIFDILANTIKNDVPNAFQKGIDGIKKIWDTLLGIAKAPVLFVIDKVINEGLIGSFNTVAGFLPGVEPLKPVGKPKGWSGGGWTGPGSKYQPAGVVHADEFVVKKSSRRGIERRAPGLLDSMNRFGASALSRLGYANGGRVNPVKNMALTQGYSAFHDGIDIGVPVGTPVFATGPGVVDFAGVSPNLGNIWGGNEIRVMGDGLERWFSHLSQIMVKVGQKVNPGQQIGLSGNSGITSGPHLHFGVYQGGYPNSMNPLDYLAGASAPAGGDGGGGFNPIAGLIGMARDKLTAQFPAGGKMVDMAIGTGEKLIGGVSEWVKGKLATVTNAIAGGVENVANAVGDTAMKARWTPTATKALIRTGHGEPWALPGNLSSMLRRMMQESGGDPDAVNNWDSNAAAGQASRGLMQVIPSTFEAYRDRGLSADIFNPLANMVASVRYTQDKFGDLRRGWDQAGGYSEGGHVSALLYDQGGVLRPGLSQIVNKTGKPEAIYTNEQNRALQALAARGAQHGRAEGDKWYVQLPQQASVGDLMDAVSLKQRVNNRGGARR